MTLADLKPTPPRPAQVQHLRLAEPPKPEQPTVQPAAPDPLTAYLDLEIEARMVPDLDSLRFAIVNSTRKMAPYEQAFLLERAHAKARWKLSTGSSVDHVDRDTALAQALESWANAPQHAENYPATTAKTGHLNTEAEGWGIAMPALPSPYLIWQPITDRKGEIQAVFLALKSENWRPQHITFLASLANAYGHAWAALRPARKPFWQSLRQLLFKKGVALGVLAALNAAGFIPVPMSTLAPAEIVGAAPALVTAPLDGVIRDILVAPGTQVTAGQVLVSFVDTKLRNDVEIATRTKSVAEAKYFKTLQAAATSQKDVQDLSIAKSELAVAEAELAFAKDMLSRTQITAPKDGIFVYSAKSDWLGKPVQIGERMMEILNPEDVELRVDIPVSDAISLKQGAKMKLFLDGDPLHSVTGTLTRTSYRATPNAEHQMVFRAFAELDTEEPLRIGLHGTARLSGDTTLLGLYLLRHPIAALRQKIGL